MEAGANVEARARRMQFGLSRRLEDFRPIRTAALMLNLGGISALLR